MYISKAKKLPIYFFTSSAILIFLYFFLKVFQFQSNLDDFCDGYISLQLSKSWLDGRPLLYDTFFGYHNLQHNYFFILLLGVFTKSFGVYGLFIGYLLLIALLLFQWYLLKIKNETKNILYNWIAILAYCFGPVAYYIYMDFLGWHSEQYFLPLIGLFILSRAKGNFYISLVWLLLILMVKETSSVLLCAILLVEAISKAAIKKPKVALINTFFNPKTITIVVVFLLVFIANVIWINYLNKGQPTRLSTALNNFDHITRADFVIYSFIYFCIAAINFIIGLLPIMPLINQNENRKIYYLVIGGGYLILFFLFYMESFFFTKSIDFGVSYPPRIGGLWAYMMACFLFYSNVFKQSQNVLNKNYLYLSVFLQFIFGTLIVSHQANGFFENRNFKENLDKIVDSKFGISPFYNGTGNQLYKLAKKLPADAEIVAHRNQLSYFTNVYPIDWDLYKKHKPLNRPYLYIYDKKLINKYENYYFPPTGYLIIKNNDYLILADAIWYNKQLK